MTCNTRGGTCNGHPAPPIYTDATSMYTRHAPRAYSLPVRRSTLADPTLAMQRHSVRTRENRARLRTPEVARTYARHAHAYTHAHNTRTHIRAPAFRARVPRRACIKLYSSVSSQPGPRSMRSSTARCKRKSGTICTRLYSIVISRVLKLLSIATFIHGARRPLPYGVVCYEGPAGSVVFERLESGARVPAVVFGVLVACEDWRDGVPPV
jgi:hypothetical protein